MEILPLDPIGRPVVEGYGGGRFRIAGRSHEGSVLILPDRAVAWDVRDMTSVTVASLGPVLQAADSIDILVLGCGAVMALPEDELRRACREAHVALEVMDTGAACRTFNVLLGENRRVAAALIAVP